MILKYRTTTYSPTGQYAFPAEVSHFVYHSVLIRLHLEDACWIQSDPYSNSIFQPLKSTKIPKEMEKSFERSCFCSPSPSRVRRLLSLPFLQLFSLPLEHLPQPLSLLELRKVFWKLNLSTFWDKHTSRKQIGSTRKHYTYLLSRKWRWSWIRFFWHSWKWNNLGFVYSS